MYQRYVHRFPSQCTGNTYAVFFIKLDRSNAVGASQAAVVGLDLVPDRWRLVHDAYATGRLTATQSNSTALSILSRFTGKNPETSKPEASR